MIGFFNNIKNKLKFEECFINRFQPIVYFTHNATWKNKNVSVLYTNRTSVLNVLFFCNLYNFNPEWLARANNLYIILDNKNNFYMIISNRNVLLI